MQNDRFRITLYRYFFFGWLFRDMTRGSLLERAAAWRHNQGCARWLPTYMRRWAVLGGAFFGAGWLAESMAPPLVQLALYLPSALSVPVNAVILAAWLGLHHLPAPHR